MDWKEEFYIHCLGQGISPEIVKNYEMFPEFVSNYFLTKINKHGYFMSVKNIKNQNYLLLSIRLTSKKVNRLISITVGVELYPVIYIMLYKADGINSWDNVILPRAMLIEQQGPDAFNEFDLKSYEGTFQERVRDFFEWLYNSLQVKGIDLISGKSWTKEHAEMLDGYK